MALLHTLRRSCEDQLRDKRAQIQALSKQAKGQKQEQGLQQRAQQRGVERAASASTWLTQRAVLASKVKKVSDELASMTRRVKSATRSSGIVASRTRELKFDAEAAKVAITREIVEVEHDAPLFLQRTLETEAVVKEELTKKLVELERTQVEIKEFQKGVLELLQQQRVNAMQESRLRVLRSELAELRDGVKISA
jgi:hypothetical protein